MLMADSDQDASEGILVRALRMAEQAETQRAVPRSPRFYFNESEELVEFLKEDPPTSAAIGPERISNSKTTPGSSNTDARRGKQPLDFFRTGRFHSKHLRGLLRSRSASPPSPSQQQTLENAYVVQKISLIRQQTPDNTQYTRILRDSSQTDSLDNLSTYRVNYTIGGADTGRTRGIGSKATGPRSFGRKQEQSQVDQAWNSRRQDRLLSEVLNQQTRTEANKISVSGQSQQQPARETQGSGLRSHSVPRQGAPPQIRDFAEEGPEFPDPELIATIERKKCRNARKMIPGNWEEEDNELVTVDERAMLKSANVSKPVLIAHFDGHDQAIQRRQSRRDARTSLALSAETQSADVPSVGRHSKESTGQSISASDNNDTATDITVPSVTGNHIELHRFRGTASPKPAPTGPLPPLPEGADSSKTGKYSFQQIDQERLQLPGSPLSLVPPKSPARNRQALSAHPTYASNGNVRTMFELDLKWPNPPGEQDSVRSRSQARIDPHLQEYDGSDNHFVSRINQTTSIKRRDLRSNGRIVGKSLKEGIGKETEKLHGEKDQIGRDKRPPPNQRLIDFGNPPTSKKDEPDTQCNFQSGQSSLGFSAIQTIIDRAPVEIEPPTKLSPSNVRTIYRSRGTQCSSDHESDNPTFSYQSTKSRVPSLVLIEPDVDSAQECNNAALNTTRQQSRRPSASDSRISSDSRCSEMRANTPEHLTDTNDLESRMEARLASFEQKTMLLEAALLGIINTNVRNATGVNRPNRASIGSRNGSQILWETAIDGMVANIESKGLNEG